jgi:alpha-L-arabinofuranosidase
MHNRHLKSFDIKTFNEGKKMNNRKLFYYSFLYLMLCVCVVVRGDLVNRYSFTNGDTTAVDSVGGQNGSLVNGATISSNAVQLNGTGAYVNLPDDLITGFTAVSFEAWFTRTADSGTWTRVWDFGNTSGSNGCDYVFFTPKSGSNTFRYAISDADPGYSHENYIETTPTATGVPVYVAVVHNSTTGAVKLYVNGSLVSSGTFTIPLSSVNNVFSYLGRSLYNPDPYLKGSIDEFRIYDEPLDETAIAQHYLDGPDVIGPSPVVIQETDGSTEVTEGNSTPDTYTVALSSQPGANVTLTVDPDEQLDIGNGRGGSVLILFTSQDWSAPRTVTVRAYDDDVWETEPHLGLIRHYISSSDPNFNNKPLPSVRVTVWDNECGAWGFYYSDLNYDCLVNFKDFAIFALEWLSSSNPITLETLVSEWLKTTRPYAPDAQHGPVQDSPEYLFIEPNEIIGLIDEKTYGHFLEHIYHSVNGGLWGELVWNRSFEQYSGGIGTHWTSYGNGTFSVISTDPKLNSTYYQRIVSTGTETGIQQTPFFIENGQTYYGSLWARCNAAPASLVVRLKNDSNTIQQKNISVTSSAWLEYPFTFTPNQSAEDATLQVGVTGSETVYLDQVSMMGQDANAIGGYRPDLYQAVEDLHPPVIRWPGGCFASAYLWKDGIGPQVSRVVYPIVLWDDKDVDSYGTDEFIRMCHAMGVEPIIVINTGILSSTCGVSIPDRKTESEYIQDAKDWVQYCNGPASSTWGAVRTANGHPEPYNVKYWEIDNETWGAGSSAYSAKVQAFVPAMKAVDPNIKIIACGGSGYDQSWNQAVINACATIIDYISIHHYEDASNYRTGPPNFEAHIAELGDIIAASANPNIKIDMSEWNAQSTDWRTGLYAGGLLNGFERNSDVFEIGGPALFLRHTSATGWDNAFINFDHTGWFPAPNYVVMKLWCDNYAPYRINMTGPVGNLNAIATKSDDDNKIYFKVVNPTDQSVPVKLVISDTFDVSSVSLQLVAPDSLSARNTLENPNTVRAEDRYASLNNQTIRFTMPRFSAGVVQVSRKE